MYLQFLNLLHKLLGKRAHTQGFDLDLIQVTEMSISVIMFYTMLCKYGLISLHLMVKVRVCLSKK